MLREGRGGGHILKNSFESPCLNEDLEVSHSPRVLISSWVGPDCPQVGSRYPEVPRGTPGSPRVPCTRGAPGTQGYPGYPEVPGGTPGVPQGILGYPGVPQGPWSTPGQAPRSTRLRSTRVRETPTDLYPKKFENWGPNIQSFFG